MFILYDIKKGQRPVVQHFSEMQAFLLNRSTGSNVMENIAFQQVPWYFSFRKIFILDSSDGKFYFGKLIGT